MTMIRKILAVCIALALLCGIALAESVPADAVVLTVGDQQFTAQQLDSMAYMLYSEGVTETYPDYDQAVEYLTRQAVLEDYLKANGYTQFTAEEEEGFQAAAQTKWEGYLDNYVQYYLTEDTDEARAELRKQAEEFFISQGASMEKLIENEQFSAAVERMEADITDGYIPSEEEITDMFQELGALYRNEFEGNVPNYELYTMQYGYESLYVPEGYRAVLHILLDVDKDVLSAYTDAQAKLEEVQSEETVDEAAVAEARAAADAAFDAVLASRQEVIDEIYARLDKGEAFEDLIAEYGTDPGMQNEENLKNGYKVHADSIIYDAAFTAGAFQERMQKPGDWSDPVVGSFGIHILYYLDDVPGGLIMTDSIHDEIAQVLSSQKLNDAYNAVCDEWAAQLTIERNDDLIAQLKAEAQQLQEKEAEKAE